MKQKSLLAMIFVLLVFTFQNCGDVNMKQNQEVGNFSSVAMKSEFCTTPQENVITNLKTIFIVDRSGSNATDGALLGTDPTKELRFAPMVDFVGEQPSSPNVQWMLIPFSDSARAIPVAGFTANQPSFLAAIQTERNLADGGNTSYLSALDKVIEKIRQDVNAAKLIRPLVSSSYVIFFISDGKPGKVITPIPPSTNDFQPEPSAEIYGKISELMALRELSEGLIDGIQLNTGYYTNLAAADPEAVAILTEMSRKGKGKFIPFTRSTNIDFRAFASINRQAKLELKEVWALNASGVWQDNEFLLDSDGDSLSDESELSLGSNQKLRDTDGNGVRDGIENQFFGHPCLNNNCSAGSSREFPECGVQPPAGYLDEDKDLLNSCEESLLRSSDLNFDSTLQYVPDEIILRSKMSFNSTGELQADSDWDGLTNYQEIKRGLPIDEDNSAIGPFSQTQLRLSRTASNSKQSCYNLQIDGLQTFSGEDEIHLFLIESSNVVNRTKRIRSMVVPAKDLTRQFTDGDFR